jgi:2-phospho-L-lactate guanylyltransferase
VSTWSVVVPAKRIAVAKSRLRPLTAGAGGGAGAGAGAVEPAPSHAEWVLALLADTVAAAAASPLVAAVLVVTDDDEAARVVRGLGATTVPDLPDRGLNPALAHGASRAVTSAVAALSSDLPALRAAELTAALGAALDLAGAAAAGFVADAAGTGTTLLTAVGRPLDPRFGPGSAAAHAAAGASRLAGSWPGLCQDVDTVEDLRAAGRLGLGRHTAALLARTRLPAGG